jgi:1-phosphofructokinase
LTEKKVAVDTSGEGLRQAVAASPWLIKPNHIELQELVGETLESNAAILHSARALMQRHGIACVITSMGKDGAIFAEGEKAVWAVPPLVTVKSTVGAGDAMLAGAIAGKIQGLPLVECARLATAFSLSAITHIGAGLLSLEAIENWQSEVTLHDLDDH